MNPKGKQAKVKGHMGLWVEIEHGFSFSFLPLAAKLFSEELFVTEIFSFGRLNIFQEEKNVFGNVFLGRG